MAACFLLHKSHTQHMTEELSFLSDNISTLITKAALQLNVRGF